MENKRLHIITRVYTNLCRFVLSLVFIFSGFVKANDPLGFKYKIIDYLEAFGLTAYVPDFFPMFSSVMVSVIEFTLGVYLLFGINRRLTSWLVTLLLGVMTPLTLYLALANPVSDCGCFGDALILTNWETFWKNVLLMVASVSVLKWKDLMFRVITPRSEWLVSFYTLMYVAGIMYYCLQYLPIFDFRPYHVGANIPEGMIMPEGKKPPVFETLFIMEKDGERREFTVDDYPDDTWTYVDRKTTLKEKGYEPPIHDFSIVKVDDGEDITDEVLSYDGYTFFLVTHRIEEADDGYIDLINEIYEYSLEYGYRFYCLTSSSDDQIELWKDKTGAEYPFCGMDDITLKTMVRSNPGLILLREGVILKKWSQREFPDEYQLTDRLEVLPVVGEYNSVPRKVIVVVLWFIFPLMGISMLDRLYHWWVCRRNKNRKIVK